MGADGGNGRGEPNHQDAVYGGPIDWDALDIIEEVDADGKKSYHSKDYQPSATGPHYSELHPTPSGDVWVAVPPPAPIRARFTGEEDPDLDGEFIPGTRTLRPHDAPAIDLPSAPSEPLPSGHSVNQWVDFAEPVKPRGPLSPRAEKEQSESPGNKVTVSIDQKLTEDDLRPWADGFYSPWNPKFHQYPKHINPEASRRVPEGEFDSGVNPLYEQAKLNDLSRDPKDLSWYENKQRRAMGRPQKDSALYLQVLRDMRSIVDARGWELENGEWHTPTKEKWNVPSTDVFFRCEALDLQKKRGWDREMELPWKYGESEFFRPVKDLPRLPDEIIEDELRIDFDLAFNPLVKELDEMKTAGASEGEVFKKILDDVRAFPYRSTANSLTAAFAGRTREATRTKRGVIHELATLFERPGLNCEGRAKLFCALLEAAGYDPETEIFLNWPKHHVQTLLKQKDGTYLAFEGNGFRPFIQRFVDPTDGVCSLQEWKYTLYGVPTKKVIESVDISQPEFVSDEDTMDPESPTPETPAALATPETKPDAPWQESPLEIKVAETVEKVFSVGGEVLSGVLSLFAGKPNPEERVDSAYPTFAAPPVVESMKGAAPVETPAQKVAEERRLVRVAQKEALRKLIEPKIAALQKVWKEQWPLAMGAMAPALFFAYGAMFEHKGDEHQPSTEDEIVHAEKQWQDAGEAAGRDMEVRILSMPAPDPDWEARLERQALDAPYTYGEFDLIPDVYGGTAKEETLADGRTVHTVHVGDDVRVVLPNAFRAMVERDLRVQVETGRGGDALWVIEGNHLNITATQKALSAMPRSGHSFVSVHNVHAAVDDFGFKETWVLQNQNETEQLQVMFAGRKMDVKMHSERWGELQKWDYRLAFQQDESVFQGLAKVSAHELQKEFGSTDYYAPVNAIPLEEKQERKSP